MRALPDFPKAVEPSGVQNTVPGEVAELDFGFLGMLPGPNGKPVKTWGLVVVLGYSRDGYYAICYDQNRKRFVKKMKRVQYFGGVPEKLKSDNMRAAILKNQHYDLQCNQDFLSLPTITAPSLCSVSHTARNKKGKWKQGFKYMQLNFVSGRDFKDDSDLKAKLIDWMDNYANKRVHGTTKKVPFEVLQFIERPALQTLPRSPLPFSIGVSVKSSLTATSILRITIIPFRFPLAGRR